MEKREPAVPEPVIAAARESYERCCQAPDFFLCFYRNFFKRCPQVEPMFENTDFQRQHKLLRHGIGLLLAFPSSPTDGPLLLRRVADRHSRKELGVAPDLYPDFVESLIQTVSEHDPEFTEQVEEGWRRTIAPGIAYMQNRF